MGPGASQTVPITIPGGEWISCVEQHISLDITVLDGDRNQLLDVVREVKVPQRQPNLALTLEPDPRPERAGVLVKAENTGPCMIPGVVVQLTADPSLLELGGQRSLGALPTGARRQLRIPVLLAEQLSGKQGQTTLSAKVFASGKEQLAEARLGLPLERATAQLELTLGSEPNVPLPGGQSAEIAVVMLGPPKGIALPLDLRVKATAESGDLVVVPDHVEVARRGRNNRYVFHVLTPEVASTLSVSAVLTDRHGVAIGTTQSSVAVAPLPVTSVEVPRPAPVPATPPIAMEPPAHPQAPPPTERHTDEDLWTSIRTGRCDVALKAAVAEYRERFDRGASHWQSVAEVVDDLNALGEATDNQDSVAKYERLAEHHGSPCNAEIRRRTGLDYWQGRDQTSGQVLYQLSDIYKKQRDFTRYHEFQRKAVDRGHPRATVDQAIESFQNQRYEEAERLLNSIREKSSAPYDAFLYLGLIADHKHDAASALSEFRRAIEIDPSCAKCFLEQGRILLKQTKRQEMIDSMKQACKLAKGATGAQSLQIYREASRYYYSRGVSHDGAPGTSDCDPSMVDDQASRGE
jgi:hypothetical protein